MKQINLISLISFALALSACQRMNNVASETTAPKSNPAPVLSESPGSIGKPSAPVTLSYQLKNTPVLSEPLSIVISIKPLIATQSLTLNYTVTTGLTSLDSVTTTTFSAPTPGQDLTHGISILPQQEGLMYVNVFVTLHDASGINQTKALTIPISLGDKAKQKPTHPNKPYIQQDPQGNPIITLPAEESHK
jgi:hypothetical protein